MTDKIRSKTGINSFLTKYGHALPLILYGIIYWIWFWHLESAVTNPHQIHMKIDDFIPFCEVFVIPYFLWFLYVPFAVIYFFFQNKKDYYKTCAFLFTGMTVFLIVSTLFPNGHDLRPAVLPRDNLFTSLLDVLWKTDPPVNLCPSIHVYDSLGAHFAIARSGAFSKNRKARLISFLVAVSIIASTVLIKQHSVFDVLTAFLMAAVMYVVVYVFDPVSAVGAAILQKKR